MNKPSLASYITGFIASIVLTLAAYILTEIHVNSAHETISHPTLIAAILALAFIQLAVQLFLFLHLGGESGPRLKLAAFVSTFAFVLLIVLASLWIMNHLNYNMMASPQEMQQYINNQQGF